MILNKLMAIGLLSFATLSYAGLQEGLDSYAQGKFAAAVPDLKGAAEKGNAVAQLRLGTIYQHGFGVPRNSELAVQLYRKSAEQGNANAQFKLARMCESGFGTPQNYQEALKWYLQSASNGFPEAYQYLGILYDSDPIFSNSNQPAPKKDAQQALLWFSKAADAKVPSAAIWLGVKYEQGRGVTKDLVKAYQWYVVAVELGRLSLTAEAFSAPGDRDRVAKKLTQAEIESAKHLASQWLAAHPGKTVPDTWLFP